MSTKQAIRVSEEVMKEIIAPYAKLRGYEIEVAVDRLLHIGWSRHKALQGYADATSGKAAKPKAAKKAKAAGAGKKKRSSGKKKRASSPPLAVAAGEANAPAPVAEQELDDNFDPIVTAPAAVVVEPEDEAENAANARDEALQQAAPAPAPAAGESFDPFETYDADAPDDPEATHS